MKVSFDPIRIFFLLVKMPKINIVFWLLLGGSTLWILAVLYANSRARPQDKTAMIIAWIVITVLVAIILFTTPDEDDLDGDGAALF